jgi:DNA-binding beta-propeller fold protein YncE
MKKMKDALQGLAPALTLIAIGLTPAIAHEQLVRVGTMQIPGASARRPFTDFDLSFADAKLDLYFLSDVSNKAIDVFRASSGAFLFRVDGFAGHKPPGYAHVGPTGIVTVGNEVWVADAPSTVKVIDLATHRIVDTINTGGSARADTLSYDDQDHVILVTNPDDSPRFATLVSTQPGHAIKGKIEFPRATADLEASVWSPGTGLFYLLISELDGRPGDGGVAAIDPTRRAVVSLFPLKDCRPTGVALGPQDQLLLGCLGGGLGKTYGFAPRTFIMDARTGSITATIDHISGSDQVWYNAGDNRYYVAAEANSGGPIVAAIGADEHHAVLTTNTQSWAHSIAVDANSNRVFVPFAPKPSDSKCRYGCIAVFSVQNTDSK